MAEIVGTAVVKILPDTTGFSAALSSQMAGATAALTGMGGAATGSVAALKTTQASLAKTATAAKATGATLTKFLTIPILGIGAIALKVAADFQTSMLQVQAVSGATAEQFEELNDLAKELGRTTQFSAAQAADGMGFLAMAGFEVQEILDAMPGVLNLAAAGNLDLAQAADIASNILSGYALQASEIGRVNDVMAQTFTSTNTSLAQLGEAFKFVAPVAAASALELEEVNAALGLLGNAGIQGSMAGTTLRGAIAKLNKPSAEAAESLARLNITVFDANKKMLPLVDIVKQFEEAGLNTADAMTIFGLRAGPGFQALVSQGSAALGDLTAENRRAGGEIEAITEKLGLNEKQVKSLGAAFDATQASVQGAGANLDETSAVLGAMIEEEFTATQATETLNGALNAMGQEGFAELIGATRNAQGQLVGAEGEVISFIEAISILQSQGLTTAEAFKTLGDEGASLADIASLDVDVIGDLFQATSEAGRGAEIAAIQMSGIRGSMLRMKSAAEGVAIAFGESGALDAIANLAESFAGLFQRLAGVNPAVFRFISLAGLMLAALGPLFKMWGGLNKALANYVGRQLDAVAAQAAGTTVTGSLTTVTASLNAALRTTATRLWNIATNPVVLVLIAIALALKLMWENSEELQAAVKRLTDLFGGAFASALGFAGDQLARVATFLGDKVASGAEAAGDAIAFLINLFVDKLEPALSATRDFLAEVIDKMRLVINAFRNADDFVGTFGETMDDLLGGTGRLTEAFEKIGGTILSVRDTFRDAGSKIGDAFGGVIKMFQGLFTLDWDTFKEGAEQAFEGIVHAAGDLFLRLPFIVTAGLRNVGNMIFANITDLPVVGPLAVKAQEIFNGVIDAIQQTIIGMALLFQGEFDEALEWLGGAGETLIETLTSSLPGLFVEYGNLLRDLFVMAYEAAVDAVIPVWDRLFEQARTFVTTTLPAAFADLGTWLSGPFADGVVAAIEGASDLGQRFATALADKLAGLPVVGPLVTSLREFLSSAVTEAAKGIDIAGALFSGDFAPAGDALGDISSSVADAASTGAFEVLPGAFKAIGDAISGPFASALGLLDTDIPVLSNLVDLLQTLAGSVGDVIGTVADAFGELQPIFTAITDNVGPTLGTIGQVIRDDILPAVGELADPLRDIVTLAVGLGKIIATVLGGIAIVAIEAFELAVKGVTAVFRSLDEIIRPLAEFVGDVVRVAFETFRDLLGEVGDIIRSAVDVFAGLWDVLKGIVTLDPGKVFDGLKQALGGLGELLKTFFLDLPALILDTLGGLAGALGGLALDLGEAILNGLVDGIKGLAGFALSLAGAVIGLFVEGIPLALGAMAEVGGAIIGAIGEQIGKVPSFLGALVDVFEEVFGAIFDWVLSDGIPMVIDAIGTIITEAPGALLGLTEALLAVFFTVFEFVLVAVGTGINRIVTFFIDLPGNIVTGLLNFGTLVWEALQTAVTFIGDSFLAAASLLWEFWRDLPGTIIDFLVNFGPDVWDGIVAGLRFIWEMWDAWVDTIVQFFIDLPGKIITALANIGTTVWEAVSVGFTFIKDQAVEKFQAIVDFVTGLPETIATSIAGIGGRVWALAETAFNTMKTNLTGVFTSIKEFIVGADGEGGIVNAIVDGIKSIPDLIGDALDSIMGLFATPFRWIAKNVWNPFAGAINAGLSAVGLNIEVPAFTVPEAHAGGIIGSTVRGRTSLSEAGGPGEQLVNMQMGEGVIPRGVMDQIGDETFSRLQAGRINPEDASALGLTDATFDPRDEMGGGILGLGVGPDIGPDIPGFVGDVARGAAAKALEIALAPLRGILSGILGIFPDNFMADFVKSGVNKLMDSAVSFVKGEGGGADISPEWVAAIQNAVVSGGANLVGFTFNGTPTSAGDLTPFINDMAANAGQPNSYPWILKYLMATGVPFRVTSTIRNSLVNGTDTPSLHNSGRAVDLAGVSGLSVDSPELLAIYNALGPAMSALHSRIYSGPGGGGFGLPDSITAQDHHDHVHTALRRGGLITSDTFARLGEAGDELVLPMSDPRRVLDLAMRNGLFPVLQEGVRQRGTSAARNEQGGTVGGQTPTVVNNDITVVGVSFDQAMSEITAKQDAQIRRIRR